MRLPKLLLPMLMLAAWSAQAADIGQIKVSSGSVTIDRGGQALPGGLGARVQQGDVVKTGANGSVGITMSDNSLLSAGPNSVLALDQYAFDTTTNQGRFDASLAKGTLAVVSGRLVRQSPGAMTVRTPSAILGVRGTEFVVSADGGPASH
ncbi:MAG: FecR domain-containing protein [Candidatus Levyibacteriota bacterium]